jgi:hypothetical protein
MRYGARRIEMATKVKDLIKKLQEKEQDDEVEYVIASTKGEMVCIDIETQAYDLARLLKMFKRA